MILLLVFFIALLMGVPIAFALGFSALSYMLLTGNVNITLISQRLYVGLDNFIFLAVPFFILAAKIMDNSKINEVLVNFANSLFGYTRGGLAQVNIFVSILFAGITGAGTADTAAIGSVMIPSMIKNNYSPSYSAAVTAASSVIGPTIPPSIVAIIYAIVTEQSVAAMLLAGIIPGILLGLSQMVLVSYQAKKYNFPRGKKRSWSEVKRTFKEAYPALLIPITIIGGLLTGFFTPTEAAAISVFISFILGKFYYKKLNLREIPKILLDTAILVGSLELILGMAASVAWVLTFERIPQRIIAIVAAMNVNPFIILLLINLLLLFVGTFMETIVSVIILAPILLPIAMDLGIDPIHFGAIMVLNLNIGLATPPVGVCLFIACQIAHITIEEISKSIFPFILISIIILLLITYIRPLSMFIPNLYMKLTYIH